MTSGQPKLIFSLDKIDKNLLNRILLSVPLNHANLFIPFGAKKDESLKWRLALLEKEKLLSSEQFAALVHDLNHFAKNKLSQQKANAWFLKATSSDFQITEIDLACIFTAFVLLNIDDFTDSDLAMGIPTIGAILDVNKRGMGDGKNLAT